MSVFYDRSFTGAVGNISTETSSQHVKCEAWFLTNGNYNTHRHTSTAPLIHRIKGVALVHTARRLQARPE